MPNHNDQVSNTQMPEGDSERRTSDALVALAGLLVICLVICLGIFAGIELIAKSPIWSEKGAAWVQAIGSIAAIFCAIYVLKRQGEQAAKLAKDTDSLGLARRLAAIEALVERAYEMAKTVEVHTEPVNNYWDYFFSVVQLDQLKFMRGALSTVPLYTLESYNLVAGVHEMIIGLERLEPLVVIHEAAGDVHYVFEGDDAARAKYVCKKIREARNLVRAAILEMGHRPISPDDEASSVD